MTLTCWVVSSVALYRVLYRVSAAAQLPAALNSVVLSGAARTGTAHALAAVAPSVPVTCPVGHAVQTVVPTPVA